MMSYEIYLVNHTELHIAYIYDLTLSSTAKQCHPAFLKFGTLISFCCPHNSLLWFLFSTLIPQHMYQQLYL